MTCWEIYVQGHLDQDWSEELGSLTIMHEAGGKTQLFGPLPDQAALYGMLLKLSVLSIPLVSVQQCAAQDAGGAA
jgi:hypothetical protein